MNDLNGFISTALERYVNDKYIESILQLIVPFGIKINQTLLECSIGHLDNSSVSVLVESSGTLATVSLYWEKSILCLFLEPVVPSGFRYSREIHKFMNTTLTFEWDLPQGLGTENIVDYYVIYIFPEPLSHPIMNVVSDPPWNVTLQHNVKYSTNITAVNCAGQSETFTYSDIEYSKFCLKPAA